MARARWTIAHDNLFILTRLVGEEGFVVTEAEFGANIGWRNKMQTVVSIGGCIVRVYACDHSQKFLPLIHVPYKLPSVF